MARHRVGHAGVNAHLHKFGMKDTHLCRCGESETIEHFFMHCVTPTVHRNTLNRKLLSIGVNFNFKNILGGGNFTFTKKIQIVEHVAKFLFDNNKMCEL